MALDGQQIGGLEVCLQRERLGLAGDQVTVGAKGRAGAAGVRKTGAGATASASRAGRGRPDSLV